MKLVLLHGVGQGAESWDKVRTALAAKYAESLEIFAPALFELGGDLSDFDGVYRAVEAYCEQFTEPFALCGLSLGGVIALKYAARRPEKLAALVLIGAQYNLPRGLMALNNLALRLFMPKKHLATFHVKTKAELTRFMASVAAENLSEALPRLAMPVLVICGTRDAVNLPAARQMAAKIPGARLELIASGHVVNEENPAALADCVGAFVAEAF
ncbi:MAG: alpha/beta hydrolase [Oscillospiraceae bacterium]|jgi:pimeloyl-ACP methyl ester carboxylesterase|nr:alpha/beta hydrolase [Oscillospiraceae bacterium]